MEEKNLENGQARIKYETIRLDDSEHEYPREVEWQALATALETSEALGAAPILPDGKVGGNGAFLSSSSSSSDKKQQDASGDCCTRTIYVSRSGRAARAAFTRDDFVRVTQFDKNQWRAQYTSSDPSIRPSSDTPLLWHALIVAPKLFDWTLQPKFVLHGHSCSTLEEASAKNLPCSPEETLFSTPEDLDALLKLMKEYPYPKNQIYVRRNHGFFLLSQNSEEACHIFQHRLASSSSSSSQNKRKDHDDDDDNKKVQDEDVKEKKRKREEIDNVDDTQPVTSNGQNTRRVNNKAPPKRKPDKE